MRVVVTGMNGQVVQSLVEYGMGLGHVVIPLGRPHLDLARDDATTMQMLLAGVAPQVIVSAAAYTEVDRAESEPNLAQAVNATGAGRLAQVAHELGVPMVHLSTDYVFSGEGDRAWREDDPTAPKGVYGATKLAGEKAVRAACANSVVLRTAWVYSPFGVNFVKTMLRSAETRDELSVVADQVGNPTSAFDVADGVLAVAENLLCNSDPALRGVFHMAGMGETSWAEFAEAIFAASSARGGPVAQVKAITTAQYPTPAARPTNSRLDCTRLAEFHGIYLSAWQSSLDRVIGRLLG